MPQWIIRGRYAMGMIDSVRLNWNLIEHAEGFLGRVWNDVNFHLVGNHDYVVTWGKIYYGKYDNGEKLYVLWRRTRCALFSIPRRRFFLWYCLFEDGSRFYFIDLFFYMSADFDIADGHDVCVFSIWWSLDRSCALWNVCTKMRAVKRICRCTRW